MPSARRSVRWQSREGSRSNPPPWPNWGSMNALIWSVSSRCLHLSRKDWRAFASADASDLWGNR
eukprot:203759-Prorocentrum_lima.AAC.1